MKIKTIYAALLFLFLFAACRNDKNGNHNNHPGMSGSGSDTLPDSYHNYNDSDRRSDSPGSRY